VLDADAGGVVAERNGHPVGLLTWLVDRGGGSSDLGPPSRVVASAEIRAVAVQPRSRGQGVGRAMFEAAHVALAAAGVRATWLVTTNDNAPAIHLYESLGYRVVEVRHGAIDELRRTIKASIPLAGDGGVEMHDEIELRRAIDARPPPTRAPGRAHPPNGIQQDLRKLPPILHGPCSTSSPSSSTRTTVS
jgi:GNAT superfamily N-acetyltransferase